MKKIEMIEKLEEYGVKDIPVKLNLIDFQKYYKDKIDEIEKIGTKKPTEESVEQDIERKVDNRTPLEKKRAELFPEIVEIMRKLKGRSQATHEELRILFNLYNQFYLRNDSPSCGACVARVYKTFEKMTKGWI